MCYGNNTYAWSRQVAVRQTLFLAKKFTQASQRFYFSTCPEARIVNWSSLSEFFKAISHAMMAALLARKEVPSSFTTRDLCQNHIEFKGCAWSGKKINRQGEGL